MSRTTKEQLAEYLRDKGYDAFQVAYISEREGLGEEEALWVVNQVCRAALSATPGVVVHTHQHIVAQRYRYAARSMSLAEYHATWTPNDAAQATSLHQRVQGMRMPPSPKEPSANHPNGGLVGLLVLLLIAGILTVQAEWHEARQAAETRGLLNTPIMQPQTITLRLKDNRTVQHVTAVNEIACILLYTWSERPDRTRILVRNGNASEWIRVSDIVSIDTTLPLPSWSEVNAASLNGVCRR